MQRTFLCRITWHRQKTGCSWLLILITLFTATVHSAPPQTATTTLCPSDQQRPCIALVLGGGGARGSAHIGVLRALEEHNIPIDMVIGTSMGAFVGGLYASGKSPADIQQLFESNDWNAGYRDDLSRSLIPNRRKRQLDEFPIHLDLGLDKDGVKLPLGLLQGQGMKALVDSMLNYYPEFDSFDDLPIPFRAIAADAETSEEVILDHGDLATALHISMSIPGVVRPIVLDGRLLVDGGIANNLPVSVARSLGAEIVIAVNIGSPMMTKDELVSGIAILRQMVGFLTEKNVAYQRSLLTDKDIYIQPALQGIDTLSFEKSAEAIAAGYQEMQQLFAENAALHNLTNTLAQAERALSDQQQAEKILAEERRAILDTELPFIDHINLINQTRLADDYILHRMNLTPGLPYSLEDIRTGSERLYAQGTIARINTSITTLDDQNTLNVFVAEKDWGPGYLDLKFAFEDDFDSFGRYQIGASYRLTNLSPYGAEWYTSAEFGTEKSFLTQLYWPINTTDFFWTTGLNFNRNVVDFSFEGESYGQLINSSYSALGGFGWNMSDRLDVTLATVYFDGELTLPALLAQTLPKDKLGYEQTGLLLDLNYDTLDDAEFPRRGWKLDATLSRTKDMLDGIEDYTSQFNAEYNGVMSYKRHSLRAQLRFQSTINDDPLSLLGASSLGGFLSLSGTDKNSIVGQHVRFASLVYTYELASNDFGAIILPLYLGLSAETGNAWDARKNIDYSDLIDSGSLFVGWDSPIGPTYLAYGHSSTGDRSVYVFLGILF